jgi:hypothetical protein
MRVVMSGAREEKLRSLRMANRRLANRSAHQTVYARLRQGYGGQPSPDMSAKVGGAGICTRVRKYIPAGIYDAYPLLKSRSRREEAANNRRKPAPENLVTDIRDHVSATSLLK